MEFCWFSVLPTVYGCRCWIPKERDGLPCGVLPGVHPVPVPADSCAGAPDRPAPKLAHRSATGRVGMPALGVAWLLDPRDMKHDSCDG